MKFEVGSDIYQIFDVIDAEFASPCEERKTSAWVKKLGAVAKNGLRAVPFTLQPSYFSLLTSVAMAFLVIRRYLVNPRGAAAVQLTDDLSLVSGKMVEPICPIQRRVKW
ncbi:MAG: hypothetical protein FJ267_01800 [Planctomycetes bacterium]|nr:hypothetical protein [Planctomycetota bacterium]